MPFVGLPPTDFQLLVLLDDPGGGILDGLPSCGSPLGITKQLIKLQKRGRRRPQNASLPSVRRRSSGEEAPPSRYPPRSGLRPCDGRDAKSVTSQCMCVNLLFFLQ